MPARIETKISCPGGLDFLVDGEVEQVARALEDRAHRILARLESNGELLAVNPDLVTRVSTLRSPNVGPFEEGQA